MKAISGILVAASLLVAPAAFAQGDGNAASLAIGSVGPTAVATGVGMLGIVGAVVSSSSDNTTGTNGTSGTTGTTGTTGT